VRHFNLVRRRFWSWPRIVSRPGKYVSFLAVYFGPFFLATWKHHTPYGER